MLAIKKSLNAVWAFAKSASINMVMLNANKFCGIFFLYFWSEATVIIQKELCCNFFLSISFSLFVSNTRIHTDTPLYKEHRSVL